MKSLTLFAVTFLFLTSMTSAVTLFESLSQTSTNIKITFDSSTAKVLSQGITLRSVIDESKDGEGIVQPIAYRAYYLEFAFEQKFSNAREYASIEFYNGNTVIHVMSLADPSRKLTTTRNRLNESNYLAINLEGVPLIMLDDVTRINFKR